MSSTLNDFARAMAGSPGEALKSFPRQAYEMLQLYIRRKIGPRYYLIAGLNRRGVRLPDVLGHVNEAEYIGFVRRMNPPERRQALNDKTEQKRLLVSAGIPTPHPVYSAAGGASDAASLTEALRAVAGTSIAVKPTASFGGHGFRSFRVASDDAGVRLIDGGAALSAAELFDAMGGSFIVEPYVQQHPWYAAVNASSVNTWRIWVVKREGRSTAETVLAYLRMGRAGSRVDNMGGGGLFAPLRSDGTLGPAEDGSIFRRRYPVHPDSGTTVEGAHPPMIAEAKQLAEQALTALPDLRFAGMDIAVTEAGPVVIEVNAEPDRMGAARVGLPFRTWLIENDLTA